MYTVADLRSRLRHVLGAHCTLTNTCKAKFLQFLLPQHQHKFRFESRRFDQDCRLQIEAGAEGEEIVIM